MKNVDDIAFIVQARLNSERVPYKMLKPFAGTNLFGLVLDKLLTSEEIPSENIRASVYEAELFHENLFAVVEKKQYYWNKEGALITPWPEGQTIMNTKAVTPTYEAAHVLYASRMDLIKDERFMGDFEKPGGIKLFTMPELEAFDIDYQWQFDAAEAIYEKGLHNS